jgi:hypothetical protein
MLWAITAGSCSACVIQQDPVSKKKKKKNKLKQTKPTKTIKKYGPCIFYEFYPV